MAIAGQWANTVSLDTLVVVVELAEAGVAAPARVRAEVLRAGEAAGIAAVGGLEDRVAAAAEAALLRVGGHEHLVRPAASQPGTVAVVALGRALVPGQAAVLRG